MRKPALYLPGSAKEARPVMVDRENPTSQTVYVADERTPHINIPHYDLAWLYADTEENRLRTRKIRQGYDLIKILTDRIEKLRLALDPFTMEEKTHDSP